MNIGVKENTVQLLFIGSLIILLGVITFFKWPADVTGATTRLPSCQAPTNGMVLTHHTLFCTGAYSLPSGMTAAADGITIDCNGAVFTGEGNGIGITVAANNVLIKDCIFKGYDYGAYDQGIDNVFERVDMRENTYSVTKE